MAKSGMPKRRGNLVKPSILVLTTSYPSRETDPSGVFIAKLLAGIKNRGYAIKVVAPSDGTFYGHHEVGGIETIRFGYFRPRSLERLTRAGGGIPENIQQSLLARLQLVPMLAMFLLVALRQSRGSDLIYANWLGAGIVGSAVNLLTGKPLVVSFRGDDGYLARDRLLWRILTKWVARRATVVAPVSAELVKILVDLGVPDAKCRLPRFGVDTKMFYPATGHERSGHNVRVLFVGSLIPRKGLHDLVKAVAVPSLERVVLEVVGEGFDGDRLKSMCEELGLQSRTFWRGSVSPQQVAEIMRSADVLCLPSFMEGRPNVVNEAMASGIPVITTRIGGIPDMVREGETALLFEPGTVEQLRKHLETLVADADLRRKMGKAGHEFLTTSGVSWDATAEDFDVIFSGVITERVG